VSLSMKHYEMQKKHGGGKPEENEKKGSKDVSEGEDVVREDAERGLDETVDQESLRGMVSVLPANVSVPAAAK
jgi:hypothetical protein